MLLPGGNDNVRPVVREARVCAGENTVCEGGGAECQKEGGDVGMGEQMVHGGVEAEAGGGVVADLGEDRGEDDVRGGDRWCRWRDDGTVGCLTRNGADVGDVGIQTGVGRKVEGGGRHLVGVCWLLGVLGRMALSMW